MFILHKIFRSLNKVTDCIGCLWLTFLFMSVFYATFLNANEMDSIPCDSREAETCALDMQDLCDDVRGSSEVTEQTKDLCRIAIQNSSHIQCYHDNMRQCPADKYFYLRVQWEETAKDVDRVCRKFCSDYRKFPSCTALIDTTGIEQKTKEYETFCRSFNSSRVCGEKVLQMCSFDRQFYFSLLEEEIVSTWERFCNTGCSSLDETISGIQECLHHLEGDSDMSVQCPSHWGFKVCLESRPMCAEFGRVVSIYKPSYDFERMDVECTTTTTTTSTTTTTPTTTTTTPTTTTTTTTTTPTTTTTTPTTTTTTPTTTTTTTSTTTTPTTTTTTPTTTSTTPPTTTTTMLTTTIRTTTKQTTTVAQELPEVDVEYCSTDSLLQLSNMNDKNFVPDVLADAVSTASCLCNTVFKMCKLFQVIPNTPKSVRIFCRREVTLACTRPDFNTTELSQNVHRLAQGHCRTNDVITIDEGSKNDCTGHNYGLLECNTGNTFQGISSFLLLGLLVLHISV